eukprot:245193-Lingulodinium_polyedra.AAC.1
MPTPTPTPVTTAAGKPWTYRQFRRCLMPGSLNTSIGPIGQPRKLGVVPRARVRGSFVDSTRGIHVKGEGKASSLSPFTLVVRAAAASPPVRAARTQRT